LSLIPTAYAADFPLRPFSANYDLHKGTRHIANTKLKLKRSGELWRWSSHTIARGVYAWFTRKQPYTETSFSQAGSEFRLSEILIADARKKKNAESARFDWVKGELEVFRKGKRKQLQLQAGVYDYQSIHLLAATMGQQHLEKMTVDFYRKGKLVKSILAYIGQQDVDINGQTLSANVYEQRMVKSNSRIMYYYDAENPLLPLRIEKLETGEKPAVLTLRQVDWGL
jgi:hypothetical protein